MGDFVGTFEAATKFYSERVLSLTLKFLHFIGLWQRNDSSVYSLYTCFVAACQPVYMFLTLLSLTSGEASLKSKFNIACNVFGLFPVYGTLLTLLLNRVQFQELISNLKCFVARTWCEGVEIPLQNIIKTEKIFTVILLTMCLSSVLSIFTGPLVSQYLSQDNANGTFVMKKPTDMYQPLENESVTVFAAFYLLQFISVIVSTFIITGTETMINMLILYTSHQFDVLIIMINNVDISISTNDNHKRTSLVANLRHKSQIEEDDSFSEDELPDMRMHSSRRTENYLHMWCNFAKCQQVALRNSIILQDLLGIPLFLHYTVASIEIAIILYEMNVEEDANEAVKFYLYLFTILLRVLVISNVSSKLASKSLEVSDALMATNWYGYSQEVKTILLIMLCRAQRPIKLWAGKFTVASLETYLSILQTAYSYFNVMSTLS